MILYSLRKQLLDRKIKEENIFISPYDISISDLFYSNSRGYEDASFKGRFLSGLALIDNDTKITETPYVKVIK